MSRFEVRQSFLLFLTAFFWGTNFVAQSVAMDFTGPFSFIAARSYIGGLFLIPVILFISARRKRAQVSAHDCSIPVSRTWSPRIALFGGVLCGTLLFACSTLQQFGLLYTTVGKAGFLTSMYIVVVPLLGLCLGRRGSLRLWCGVFLAVVGLYLLSIRGDFSLNRGDSLMLICALTDSFHILFIDKFAVRTDPVRMACVQFFSCAVFATIATFIWEEPNISGLWAAIGPVLYAGIMSSGVAYTLQMVGQRGLNPAFASLIMSLESVIAALSGWALLDETLTLREFCGCVLMFLAVVIVQVSPVMLWKLLKRKYEAGKDQGVLS